MYTNDELEKLSEEDKKKQRHSIQMQMVMLESDNRKLILEKSNLDVEIKRIKTDEEQLRMSLEEKNKKHTQVDYQIAQNEEELKRMKKKLNLV